jgi:putative Holliday junction resolvase
MSFLALDVGRKRVGVAVGDRTVPPIPLSTLDRAQGRAEAGILRIITERQIERVVVGIPLHEDGRSSPQCEDVRRFIRRLERRAPGVAFVEWDEFGSSAEARERLGHSQKFHRKDRESGELDATAAAIILEGYLASGSG